MTAAVHVVSFGYLHAPPPPAHVTVDVRHHFRDPHVSPALRFLTAADAQVVRAVLATPGVTGLVSAVVAAARSFLTGPQPGPVTVAVGCAGGRHRAAVIAAEAARFLGRSGVPVTLTHRDLNKPVREHTAAPTAGSGATALPLLGKRVRIALDEMTVAEGVLLGFGDGGQFEVQQDDGLVYHAWPMLAIEEVAHG